MVGNETRYDLGAAAAVPPEVLAFEYSAWATELPDGRRIAFRRTHVLASSRGDAYKDQHRVYVDGEFAGFLDRFFPENGRLIAVVERA